MEMWGLKQKRRGYRSPERISDPDFNESFSIYISCMWLHSLQRQTGCIQGAEHVRCKREARKGVKKKQELRGFVLCVNGADAGVVLFI